MAQSGADKAFAALSAALAAAAAFFIFTVPAGAWNYSAEGASLLTGTIGGAVAAGLAVLSRRTGSNALNTIGLALGIAALAAGASMLLLGSYEIEFG
jgi:hypothetical protein